MEHQTDPDHVREHRTKERLEIRRSVRRPGVDGRSPLDVVQDPAYDDDRSGVVPALRMLSPALDDHAAAVSCLATFDEPAGRGPAPVRGPARVRGRHHVLPGPAVSGAR